MIAFVAPARGPTSATSAARMMTWWLHRCCELQASGIVVRCARDDRPFNALRRTVLQSQGVPHPAPTCYSRRVSRARENEERLTLAFAGAQEGVWDWNLETNAVVYSSRWKEMLGYADDEIEPDVSAWERLSIPTTGAARRVNESVRPARRPTRENSACATRTVTTSTCCRAAIRFAACPADRSCASSVRTSISPSENGGSRTGPPEFLARLVFAQEDERRRIAREMHDQFGEHLTALALRIRLLKDAAPIVPTGARMSSPSRPLPSGWITTSISSSGSFARRRSTTLACAPRSPTTSRTGRRASAFRRRCTRPGCWTSGCRADVETAASTGSRRKRSPTWRNTRGPATSRSSSSGALITCF